MNIRPYKRSGMTLVEVTLVIALLIIVTLILIPNVTNTHINHNRTKLIANGTGIYKSVFAGIADVQSELYEESALAFPQSPSNHMDHDLSFTNSTDYLIYLVHQDIMSVNWSYFSGPNIQSVPGRYDPEDPKSTEAFKAENNAWNVVADLNIEEKHAPFLITRNLKEDQLQSSDEKPKVDGPPYDDEALIVIRIGGAGEVLKKRNISWKNINPTGLENVILKP